MSSHLIVYLSSLSSFQQLCFFVYLLDLFLLIATFLFRGTSLCELFNIDFKANSFFTSEIISADCKFIVLELGWGLLFNSTLVVVSPGLNKLVFCFTARTVFFNLNYQILSRFEGYQIASIIGKNLVRGTLLLG